MSDPDGQDSAKESAANAHEAAPAAESRGVRQAPPARTFADIPSLILILLGVALLSISPLLPSPQLPPELLAELKASREPAAQSDAPPSEHAAQPEKGFKALLAKALKSEELPPRALVAYSLVFGAWMVGFGCFVTFSFLYAFSEDVRRRVALWAFVPRPPPAFRLVDIIAVCTLIAGAWMAARPVVLSAWAAGGGTWDLRILVVLGLFIQFGGYALGMAGLIWAARRRQGRSSSAGLWPVWSCETAVPPSRPLGDAALGAGMYFLGYWIMFASALVNVLLVKIAGIPITQNPLLELVSTEAMGPARPAVLGLLFFFAVFGAAFFEELIFRGFLYNVLKRHVSPLLAAMVCSLLFALVHNVPSQILPLFTLSMFLIYAYERTGRLLAPMILHAMNNAIAMGLILWAFSGA